MKHLLTSLLLFLLNITYAQLNANLERYPHFATQHVNTTNSTIWILDSILSDGSYYKYRFQYDNLNRLTYEYTEYENGPDIDAFYTYQAIDQVSQYDRYMLSPGLHQKYWQVNYEFLGDTIRTRVDRYEDHHAPGWYYDISVIDEIYDNGRLSEVIDYKHLDGNTINDDKKLIYHYNINGQLTHRSKYSINSTTASWEFCYRDTLIYDGTGNLITTQLRYPILGTT